MEVKKRTILATIGAVIGASALLTGCSGSDREAPTPTAPATAEVSAAPSSMASGGAIRQSPAAGPSPSSSAAVPNGDQATRALDASAVLTIADVDVVTGDLVVGGYVSGVFEDGGSCTYAITDTQSGTVVSARTTGVANNDTTSCGSASVSAEQVPAGTYDVVLIYANADGRTSSQPIRVEVKR